MNTDTFSYSAYINLQPVSQPIEDVKMGKGGMKTCESMGNDKHISVCLSVVSGKLN